mmetsp:Transcript_974/g.3616  ORF Transcript_974/g.3616 Transcript_974/m.3616 type:complete len:339 (+) Transcript_974:711-1727(+)
MRQGMPGTDPQRHSAVRQAGQDPEGRPGRLRAGRNRQRQGQVEGCAQPLHLHRRGVQPRPGVRTQQVQDLQAPLRNLLRDERRVPRLRRVRAHPRARQQRRAEGRGVPPHPKLPRRYVGGVEEPRRPGRRRRPGGAPRGCLRSSQPDGRAPGRASGAPHLVRRQARILVQARRSVPQAHQASARAAAFAAEGRGGVSPPARRAGAVSPRSLAQRARDVFQGSHRSSRRHPRRRQQERLRREHLPHAAQRARRVAPLRQPPGGRLRPAHRRPGPAPGLHAGWGLGAQEDGRDGGCGTHSPAHGEQRRGREVHPGADRAAAQLGRRAQLARLPRLPRLGV